MDIYVSNFPYETSSEELGEIFSAYGQVDDVKLIVDSLTGENRGFGFVTMGNENEAKEAIVNLNGQDFRGRPLKVKQTDKKKNRKSH